MSISSYFTLFQYYSIVHHLAEIWPLSDDKFLDGMGELTHREDSGDEY